MSTPERRHFPPAAKVAIPRKHLLEGQPVSEVCSEAGIAVSQFYQWQKIFFRARASPPSRPLRAKSAADDAKDKKITALEEKLQRKHEVLSELLEEHVRVKKRTSGEP
ncbi:MAG: transposase [Gemmataceae bacterium]